MKTMQQYWVTKKSVSRKLGGKEDECIVSSDAELDAKLGLFQSISESCLQLQKVIDIYQERLCFLAQEENTLGRYLKECSKNEKNSSAGQIMSIAGKALAYTGHQRLTIRRPLERLHHEVETFRGRAVSDTRVTVTEMEKARTEYRAALSWMKSASAQLDPDTGHGLDKFRKAQAYVRTTKIKFDRLMLACLQKVDLLAAARCNMFSHALVGYQNAISTFSNKASDTLIVAGSKLKNIEPYDFTIVTELATPIDGDKDKESFFNAEYTDNVLEDKIEANEVKEESLDVTNLLGEDFLDTPSETNNLDLFASAHSELIGLSWPTTSVNTQDFLGGDFMPSRLLQENFYTTLSTDLNMTMIEDTDDKTKDLPKKTIKADDKKSSQMSWLSLFAELDPLAQDNALNSVGDRA